LNIASKLFHESKPKDGQTKSDEVPLSQLKPSGYYACSVHSKRPPMTYSEFETHVERGATTAGAVLWGALFNRFRCTPIIIPEGDERLQLVPHLSGSDDIVGQCKKCGSSGYVSKKLIELAYQDSNNFPLTVQGDCRKCGAKIVFLQEVQSTCVYCKTPQAKRGQARCHVCGAHYH
jgi:hypothetical protein